MKLNLRGGQYMGAEHPLPELIQHTVLQMNHPRDVAAAMLVCRTGYAAGHPHLWVLMRGMVSPAAMPLLFGPLYGGCQVNIWPRITILRTHSLLGLHGYEPGGASCLWRITGSAQPNDNVAYRAECVEFMRRLFPAHAALFFAPLYSRCMLRTFSL